MDENLINDGVSGEENVYDSNYYIEAIKEMKQNSVSRSDYEKLREENRNLLKSLVNGEIIDRPVDKEPVDINNLRQDLFNKEHSNLDFITKAMELREALIESGEEDPFLPKGHNVQITDSDRATAEKVAAAFQHCIDYADGDSGVFTNELMRITQDTFRPNFRNKR